MTHEIFVKGELLAQAFTALLPFTSKAKEDDRVNGAYAPHELVNLNITNQGKLAISAFDADGAWAIYTMPLTDYEGEVTDFAITREEAQLFLGTFKPRKNSENLLKIEVEHTESQARGKDMTGTYIEYTRSTMLRVNEEGQLFGARASQFAGADNRHVAIAQKWATVASEAMVAGQEFREFSLTPNGIAALDKACKMFGSPVMSMRGFNLVARFGDFFVACCRVNGPRDESKQSYTRSIDEWSEDVFSNSEFFPQHTVREQLTVFEERTL